MNGSNVSIVEFLYLAKYTAEEAAANVCDGPDPIWEVGGYGYGEMVDGKFDMYAEWVDYDVDDCGDED